MPYEYTSQTRLLAKLIRELLARKGTPANLADLTDALKQRCARLKVPFSDDTINQAYTLIASNTPLVRQQEIEPDTAEHSPEPAVSHADAARILLSYGVDVRGGQFATKAAPAIAGPAPEAAGLAYPGAPEHFPTLVKVW